MIAGGLRSLGVGPGDRVAAYLPNIPEAVAALLACASIGAIWSSCSPDFGARSVIDRFAQIEPRVLLAVDGYRYGGKDFDRTAVVHDLLVELPTVEHTVVLGYLDPEHRRASIPGSLTWEQLRERGAGTSLVFEQVPSDHPLWVLYSSGTTGLPKAIVHGHGGIILETLKTLHLHVDLQADDRFFWFTTTGWMMWNFLVGGLMTDASIVLYDGNPAERDLGVLWDLAEARSHHLLRDGGCVHRKLPEGRAATDPREGSLGGSRGGIDRLAALSRGVRLGLRRAWRRHLALLHLGGNRSLHGVRRRRPDASGPSGRAAGESARSASRIVESGGETARRRSRRARDHEADALDAGLLLGRPGRELLPRELLRDVPGVWRHGDWIEITDRGTAVISGRSDATINRGGVRMGTSGATPWSCSATTRSWTRS